MQGRNPMADAIKQPALKSEFDEIEKSIRFLVQHMPTHQDYLAKYCPAPPL